jgi:hypothetical protein
MVDVQAQRVGAVLLERDQLDRAVHAAEAGLDLCLKVVHRDSSASGPKKKWARPTSRHGWVRGKACAEV